MSANLQPNATSTAASHESTAPLLPTADGGAEKGDKTKKRGFFNKFAKKTDEEKKIKSKSPVIPTASSPAPQLGGLRPVSPLISPTGAMSPPRTHPYELPASPGRQALRTTSPRTHSPASSMIFERNVQDEAPAQASPQIPSHITIENHIPPTLESASEAITDSKLNPDQVEIVTHATHQPAAATLTGTVTDHSMTSSLHEDLAASFLRQDADNVSNYASLETGDLRRLSFISFADVVHAEQELVQNEHRRDSAHISALGGHPALHAPRSPSPMRSPVSSQALGTSPPSSVTPSIRGHEMSPHRGVKGTGSPLLGQMSPTLTSELNIETMSQALRKTHSGDLSGFKTPMSPLSATHDDSLPK